MSFYWDDIEYLVCDKCDEDFPAESFDWGHCKNKNCGKVWCEHCNVEDCVAFIYGDKDMCTFCAEDMQFKCKKCTRGSCPSSLCRSVRFLFKGYVGYCCRATGSATPCDACQKWYKQKTCITMVGIRKFRTRSALRIIPRDVLIYAMLIPFIMKQPTKLFGKTRRKILKKEGNF